MKIYALFTRLLRKFWLILKSKSKNLTHCLLPGELSVLLFIWKQLVAGIGTKQQELNSESLGEVGRMDQYQYCDIRLCVHGIMSFKLNKV